MRPPAAARIVPAGILTIVGWTLLAFAGAYRWTIIPVVIGAVALLLLARPRVMAARTRILDGSLTASLVAVGLQLVPVPAWLRRTVSPSADAVDGALRVGRESAPFGPLTLDPTSTGWALALGLALIAVFWIARATFERRGLRDVCRGIAWIGLILAVVVFVQRFASPRHIYGFWAPITQTPDPRPLGPFVNRNDLATWLVLAIPLVIGYATARTVPQLRGERLRVGLARALDARAAILLFAVLLMIAALVASLSRSGLTGVAAALVTLAVVARGRLGSTGARAFAAALVVMLLMALPFTNVAALGVRWGDVLPADVGDRLAIWRASAAMARDFLSTGVGVGAFERGMLVYQRGARFLFFNHAHNEYLQVLVEGGVLLAVPVCVALVVAIARVARLLRRDSDVVFWFRAGAASGVVGVAVQCLWDTGLRMPANGVLFAVAAAMALHESPETTDQKSGDVHEAVRREGRERSRRAHHQGLRDRVRS